MDLTLVPIDKPDDVNVILGQSHFIKTVEDLHEALVTAVPGIKFGLAFCEASGHRLIRRTGTDEALTALAVRGAQAVGCGHVFIIALGPGFFPINVLHAVKACPEVVGIYAATANPIQVVVAEAEGRRGVLGVLDGYPPLGVEDDDGVAWRTALLRRFGYKR